MDSTPLEPRPIASTEELLAHAGWVRAFSRALIADPHAAADLEQDAWLAALESRPHGGDGLRGWWSRVVRNQAIDARRARRAPREIDEHASGDRPTPYEATAALEGQRLLVAAIGRLDEPLRTTVVRRYVQGLPSTRIAELDGVPESTVRTRLQRALERLRRDLDDRTDGGRAAWSALIAPLAVDAAPVAAAVAGFGFVAKSALAAVLVTMVLTVAYTTRDASNDGEAVSIASAPRVDVATNVVATPSTPVSARTESAVAVAPTNEASERPEELVATLTARFVTAEGRPIAGAYLASLDRSGTGEIAPDEAPRATSGADGRVELVLRTSDRSKKRGRRAGLPAGTWDPVIEAGGRGWARVAPQPTVRFGARTDLGEVVLREGGDVRIRCGGEDGAPLAGLSVWMIPPDLSLADRAALQRDRYWRSDVLAHPTPVLPVTPGTYVFRGAPIGAFRVLASVDGSKQAVSDAFELRAGDELDLPDLVLLANAGTIRGVVTLPDGSACAGAEVEWRFGIDGSWVSDSTEKDGSFRIPALEGGPIELCASAPTRPFGDAYARDVVPGSGDVELRLTEPRWIDLTVVDEAGAPIEHYSVGSILAESDMGPWHGDDRPGGRARAIARARPTFVAVDAVGFRRERVGPFTVLDAPAALTIALAREVVVRGVVRREGRGAANVYASLHPLYDSPRVRRDALMQDAGPAVSTATTSADGTFALAAPRDGRYVVAATFRDDTRVASGVLEVRKGADVHDLVLDADEVGALDGRIASSKSARASHVVLSNGGPHARIVAVEADGTFTAPGLAPGSWQLRAAVKPNQRAELLPPGETIDDPTLRSFEIRARATTRLDVDLTGVDPRAVEGRLRFDGRAPRRWTASLTPDGTVDARATSAPVLDDATFDVAAEWFGGHTLSLRSSGTDRRDDRVDAHVDVGARTVRVDLALETGTLDARGAANARRELRVELAEDASWVTTFDFDAEGRALLDGLPRGIARIRALDSETVLVEATIAAGTTRVDVP